jgi:signal transduction histidine kinase
MRWFTRGSIRRKLYAGVLFTTASALFISGFIMVLYDLRDYNTRLLQDLTTQSRLLAFANASALQFDDQKVAKESLATLEARPQILATALYNAKGALFATYRSKDNLSEEFPAHPQMDSQHVAGKQIIMFRRIVDHNEILGTIYIKASYQIYDRVWKYATIVLSVGLVALLVSMLFSFWLQLRVAQPILHITDVARQVSEGQDYSLRAEKSTDDEIGYLVDAFNALLSQVGEGKAELEQRVSERTAELERANRELEAFSYSVSHDLRTPLRAIDGFSQALLEDYSQQLDATASDYLVRVRAGAQRMGGLIDALLTLARVSRASMSEERVDLTAIAEEIVSELRTANPERNTEVKIARGLSAIGDPYLLRTVLENLLNNAWKYSSKRDHAFIEFGAQNQSDEPCFFVRDNGAGFDMSYVNKLFGAFQRLHDAKEFAGTGVGLATVQRIIHRHGGRIWAEAAIDKGATFYFTLPRIKEIDA